VHREHVHVAGIADTSEHNSVVELELRSFARFIGEILKTRLNSASDIPAAYPARVRASFRAIASWAANAGPLSSSLNRTFYRHISQDACRCKHLRSRLRQTNFSTCHSAPFLRLSFPRNAFIRTSLSCAESPDQSQRV
jgi:hypothetical protein